jgi:FkbM family methyltransferase
MIRMLRNALKLVSRPRLAYDYLAFLWIKARNHGEIVRTLHGGLEIGGFSGFSEFHSCAAFISATELRFLREFPFNDGLILDVGANLGIFTILLAKRLPEKQIHAFEPNPTTFKAMRTNFVRNRCPHAHAHQVAIAAHDGQVSLFADPIHRATTHIMTEQASSDGTVGNTSAMVRVPCLTLDSFLQTHGVKKIALLKVDVEGCENLVFQGARRLLDTGRAKVIYYEVCPKLTKRAGFAAEAASSQLLDYGYRLHRLGENGLLQPVELNQIPAVRSENWIAVHP